MADSVPNLLLCLHWGNPIDLSTNTLLGMRRKLGSLGFTVAKPAKNNLSAHMTFWLSTPPLHGHEGSYIQLNLFSSMAWFEGHTTEHTQ